MNEHDQTIEMLERIQVNTLSYLDGYMADVAAGEAVLQGGLLREVVQLIKANKDAISARQTAMHSYLHTQQLLMELPDEFPD